VRALLAEGPIVVTNHAQPEAVIVPTREYARLVAIERANEARLEAEKVIATAKAKEAEVKAKAEAEQAQLELDKQRELALQEERQRREHDVALRQLSFERQRNEVMNSTVTTRQAMQDRIAQDRQRREEAHEAAAVRQRLAAEKAELCRKERERYGRTISC